jgi:hypothetical protein
MAPQPLAFLIARLGITKTHSRPHVSNHNPFSESPFKTQFAKMFAFATLGKLQTGGKYACRIRFAKFGK